MNLIGIDKQLQSIEGWLSEWEKGKPALLGVILYGPPGSGKTESAHFVAEKLGYKVTEFNSSDERRREFMGWLGRIVSCKPLTKTLYLLDEADGIEDLRPLKEIITSTKNPIILTVNDLGRVSSLREYCVEVRYYQPHLADVVNHARSLGVKNFEGMTADFRQGSLKAYGTQGYSTESWFDKLDAMVRTGNYKEIQRRSLFYLLVRYSGKFYGKKLWEFIKSTATADLTGNHFPLQGITSKVGSS